MGVGCGKGVGKTVRQRQIGRHKVPEFICRCECVGGGGGGRQTETQAETKKQMQRQAREEVQHRQW